MRTIVEAGVKADEWSAKPVHRINFGAPGARCRLTEAEHALSANHVL